MLSFTAFYFLKINVNLFLFILFVQTEKEIIIKTQKPLPYIFRSLQFNAFTKDMTLGKKVVNEKVIHASCHSYLLSDLTASLTDAATSEI